MINPPRKIPYSIYYNRQSNLSTLDFILIIHYGTIQVAVYDNRLEITSPGKLPMGQTFISDVP